MNSPDRPETSARLLPLGGILLGGVVVAFAVVVVGVTSYFRLSPEAAILRESAMGGVRGTWNKKIALNVGVLTTGLVRAGSHLFKLAPEPQAAFDAIRAAEVGVYKVSEDAGCADHHAILTRADKSMSARGWDRVVGVCEENELVAVYVPRRGLSTQRIKCCVLVLQGKDLIVVGASGNLDPLLQIAGKNFDFKDATQHFALR
jgi:hypothetical protein